MLILRLGMVAADEGTVEGAAVWVVWVAGEGSGNSRIWRCRRN